MPTINLGNRRKRERTVNKTALQSFYNTPRWKRLRSAKFRDNPLCEICEARGLTSQTQEVHHIVPIDPNHPDEDFIFDYDNLLSLCYDCHSRLHNIIRKGMNPVEAQIEMVREVR